ncbi:MAG: hypothetical protein PVF54_03250 [Anaerolineae bacterium]
MSGLDRLAEKGTLLRRAQACRSEQPKISGIPVVWDCGKSNHFITVYRTTPLGDGAFHPYALVIHGSGSELRGQTTWGDGLY